MKAKKTAATKDPKDEIAACVLQLQEVQKRLQELTGGETDAVLDPGGKSYLLQEAQEKLRQSEAVQRGLAAMQASIINALPAHIALIDHSGVILSINDGWRGFAQGNGLHNSACGVGQNYLETCDRAQGGCSEEAFRTAAGIRAVLAGTIGEFEIEYPCHGPNEQHWFRLMVTPLEIEGAKGAVIMHINITDRKLAEEAVRMSEEQFRNMFNAAAAGIAVSTPQGRFLQANASYCRMLGYTLEELQELNFAALTHPDDLSLNLDLRDELLAGKRESFLMEKRYFKKNGDIVWTRHSVSATHAASGEIATLMVVAEDITERKQAIEELQRRQIELQILFDLMPAMVWFKDTSNGVLRVNQRAAKATGKPVEEIEGRSMRDLYPNEAAKYYADDLEVIQSRTPKMGIIENLQGAENRKLWVQTDKVPVWDKTGKVIGIIVMVQDITERKAAT
jgi:PAS domain S-box-containing protein